MLGRQIKIVTDINSYQKDINISNLPSGSYLLSIYTVQGNFTKQFIVK